MKSPVDKKSRDLIRLGMKITIVAMVAYLPLMYVIDLCQNDMKLKGCVNDYYNKIYDSLREMQETVLCSNFKELYMRWSQSTQESEESLLQCMKHRYSGWQNIAGLFCLIEDIIREIGVPLILPSGFTSRDLYKSPEKIPGRIKRFGRAVRVMRNITNLQDRRRIGDQLIQMIRRPSFDWDEELEELWRKMNGFKLI